MDATTATPTATRAELISRCCAHMRAKYPNNPRATRDKLGTRVDEWLDGNKSAGAAFDALGLDFRLFADAVFRALKN